VLQRLLSFAFYADPLITRTVEGCFRNWHRIGTSGREQFDQVDVPLRDVGERDAPGMNRTCARGLGTSVPKPDLQGKVRPSRAARQEMRQSPSGVARPGPSFMRMRDLQSGTVTFLFTTSRGRPSCCRSLGMPGSEG
jgi:hypothetical protein